MNPPPNLPPYGLELWNAAQVCITPPPLADQHEYHWNQPRLAAFQALCSPSKIVVLLRELAPGASQKPISISTPVNNPPPMSEDHKVRRIERLERLLAGMLKVYENLRLTRGVEYGVVGSARAEVAGFSRVESKPTDSSSSVVDIGENPDIETAMQPYTGKGSITPEYLAQLEMELCSILDRQGLPDCKVTAEGSLIFEDRISISITIPEA